MHSVSGSWNLDVLYMYAKLHKQQLSQQAVHFNVLNKMYELYQQIAQLLSNSNDYEQLGGDILIDNNSNVLMAYYSKYSTDRPTIQHIIDNAQHNTTG